MKLCTDAGGPGGRVLALKRTQTSSISPIIFVSDVEFSLELTFHFMEVNSRAANGYNLQFTFIYCYF